MKMEQRKEWVSCRLRDNIVQLIIQSFFVNPVDTQKPQFKRMLVYARYVENHMYTIACNQSEYYKYVVEKMSDIKKELQQKRQQTIESEQGVHVKQWHQSLTIDFRNFVVKTIVEEIFPNTDSRYQRFAEDPRMERLQAYARKVEADAYKMASSLREYATVLDEKIYKLQRELDEKRQRRNIHQMEE